MTGHPEQDSGTLLAAQLAALARYRDILDAQRAVLRMSDAGLLDRFTSEANAIIADITARDAQLQSVRAVAQDAAAKGPHAMRLAELRHQVRFERARASAEAATLAQEMAQAAPAIAAAIRKSGDDLATMVRGYSTATPHGLPTLIDRRG